MSQVTTQAAARFVVLAAVDGSALAEPVVRSASSLARAAIGGELHLVHVLAKSTKKQDAQIAAVRERLAALAWPAHAEGGGRVVGHLGSGDPADEILGVADELSADIVLVGTSGGSALSRAVLGSVADRVVRGAKCPVLVVRPKSYGAAPSDVEAACAECVSVRRETKDPLATCARHAEHHPHARLHYEYPEPFALGASIIRP